MAANNMEVGLPETWCHPCDRLVIQREAYSHHINPIMDGSSGRNVSAKKTKTVNPTQACQTTQASTLSAMTKNKGKAIADSSQKLGMQVRRS
nr:hypothetical protein [Tanacetum cinerariifolium]